MIEINRCPSTLSEGYSAYSPEAVKRLFGGQKVSPFLDFKIEGRRGYDIATSLRRISVSGVQEKFPALIESGKIRVSNPYERSTHILKPAPLDYVLAWRKQIPANEHLTMQIASQVYGIETAENGLCFSNDGRPVYITKRFDIMPDGSKLPMEDLASVIGRGDRGEGLMFKYEGCYEDIAMAIKKNVADGKGDLERFFAIVVFNYIYANGDAHLKNFSLIATGRGYRLAPAYDLMNTSLHVEGDDFGLVGGLSPNIEKSEVYEKTGHPCRLDFLRFGLLVGIDEKRVAEILDRYMEIPAAARRLIANSFLSEKMKRSYLRITEERARRFARKSD